MPKGSAHKWSEADDAALEQVLTPYILQSRLTCSPAEEEKLVSSLEDLANRVGRTITACAQRAGTRHLLSRLSVIHLTYSCQALSGWTKEQISYLNSTFSREDVREALVANDDRATLILSSACHSVGRPRKHLLGKIRNMGLLPAPVLPDEC